MNLVDQLQIQYMNLTDMGFESAMALSSFHAQPFGYLNGGATIAFCEAIAGMASNRMGQGEYVGVGQTVTAQHLRPMKAEGLLKATGTLLHGGNRNHVWEIKVTDETGRLISQVTVVNALIRMAKEA
ncbi:PaaI family thioesterase [Veillonella sp.]|uniref:PaaI family thioesterase n=1 Tax=Veillonella sp. TaxID=1926307 RepID=UPI0025D454D3|nr:PaaI family thioesterase [Veillonella sp.]